jgi:ABC-type amino acid transport system permease subunit
MAARAIKKKKNLVRLSRIKLLAGFQLNFTEVISIIPIIVHIAGHYAPLHQMAAKDMKRKI